MQPPMIKFLLRPCRGGLQFTILSQNPEIPDDSRHVALNGWCVRKSGQPAIEENTIYLRGADTSYDNNFVQFGTRSASKTITKIVEALLEFAVDIGYMSEEESKGILICHDGIWEI